MSNHEHMGLTFDPDAIVQTVAELERMKAAKRDYVYPAKRLGYDTEGRLVLAGAQFKVGDRCYTEWADAEKASDESGMPLEHILTGGALPLSRRAERQLATRLGYENLLRYTDALRNAGHTDLVSINWQTLLERSEDRFLVRTLDGKVRAVLSDRYKLLDNADLFFASAETFAEVSADIWKARLWDDGGFELFAVAGHIKGEVRTDRTFDPGDGWQSRWYGQPGDTHNAAVRIQNSETGEGGLHVRLAILRRVCCNFNVWGRGISTIHLGRSREEEGLILSDATREKEAELVWLKVRDAIRTAFNEEKFKEYIDRLNGLTQTRITEPEKSVENVVKAFALSAERKEMILRNLLTSRDLTRYGLVQAVTQTAHERDEAQDHGAASALEEIGGKLVEMDDATLAAIAV